MYDIISSLTVAIEQGDYPSLNAIARQLCQAGDVASEIQLIDYGKQCIQPSITYYKE